MKIILSFILMVAFKYSAGQVNLLTGASNLKATLIQPINAKIGHNTANRIESYVAADVNKKLFGNIFFNYRQRGYQSVTPAFTDLTTKRQLFFKQVDFNKRLRQKPVNNTLNKIADLTGSVLDVILQQYSTQYRPQH